MPWRSRAHERAVPCRGPECSNSHGCARYEQLTWCSAVRKMVCLVSIYLLFPVVVPFFSGSLTRV